MAREKVDYRDTLLLLSTSFPNRGALSVKEAAAWYGCHPKTLLRDRTFPLDDHKKVPMVQFARWMAAR